MSNSKPVLGYWNIRGRVQSIRLLLTYLGTDFNDKQYDFGQGIKMYAGDKLSLGLEFPNLPYWIDNQSKIKLTETKAIIKYVAKTRGEGVLFPKTPKLQALAEMFEGVVTDVHQALGEMAYAPVGTPVKPLEETQAQRFKLLENFLTKRKWAVGDNLSYVDFLTYEMLKKYTKYSKDFLKPYPAILNYFRKFEALPELGDYIKSTEGMVSFSPFASLKF